MGKGEGNPAEEILLPPPPAAGLLLPPTGVARVKLFFRRGAKEGEQPSLATSDRSLALCYSCYCEPAVAGCEHRLPMACAVRSIP